MAEKMEDLNLPHTIIQKIMKDALPGNVNLGKDVKNAMAKAAAMFILYITSHSTQFAQKVNRRTLLAQDIFDALQEAEFEDIIEPLKEALYEYKSGKDKKSTDTDSKPEDDDEDMEESEPVSADSDDNES